MKIKDFFKDKLIVKQVIKSERPRISLDSLEGKYLTREGRMNK